jgi:hypothetical protein
VEAFLAAWGYHGGLDTATATSYVGETYRAMVFRIWVVDRELAQAV